SHSRSTVFQEMVDSPRCGCPAAGDTDRVVPVTPYPSLILALSDVGADNEGQVYSKTPLSPGRAELAFQHRHKDLFPAFLLASDRLVRFKPLFQGQTRCRLVESKDTSTVCKFQQHHLDLTFHRTTITLKAKFFQHSIEPLRRSHPEVA